MPKLLIKWCVSCLLFIFHLVAFVSGSLDNDLELYLPDSEREILVSLTGMIDKRIETNATDYWILKLDSNSYEIICQTPVRCSFHSPLSIHSALNSDELQLTGNYDKRWLQDHLGQIVTLSGYLWHAHTAHHHTPVLMDSDPWFKD